MYLVINKWVIAVKVSNFSGQYLRNHWTLDIGVLGYIGIIEHSPEVWSVTPVTPFISNKMQRYTVYLCLETAIHVSVGISTHHQEHTQLYVQHLVLVKPLLLPAAIVEELELIYVWKLLYMFRLVSPLIIKSTHNCIYSIWYLLKRYCYLPLWWKSWNFVPTLPP